MMTQRFSTRATMFNRRQLPIWAFLMGVVAPASPLSHAKEEAPFRTWRMRGGDPGSHQYSALSQINRKNVDTLEVAWIYHTGDIRSATTECNPIIVDGMMYITSSALKVIALDAATGKERWRYDPFKERKARGVNRGVTYWHDGQDERILFTAGSFLYALDATTGNPIKDFGNDGKVDLHKGLDRDVSALSISASSPGVIYKDLLILGSSVGEGPGPAAPGHIRAYNVRTGEIAWVFHTIPHPGEFGYETWPSDAWKHTGGANSWAGMSIDPERGMVFVPTGSAAFDFWGGDRVGKNLFANCLLALDAATGERIWHFQTVHHDLWDRDLPMAPNLVTVKRNGKPVDAVAQATKTGFVFLFDRETGEPLLPIEERPVPESDLKGEQAWPTQPFPVKPPPFVRQTFSRDQIAEVTPKARQAIEERFGGLKTGHPFNPPSREGTIIFPGFDGGGEWGGAAFDPQSDLLYVNGNEMPWILTMVEVSPEFEQGLAKQGETVYNIHCAPCHGTDLQGGSQFNAPGLKNLENRVSQPQVRHQIRNGRGFMPSFQYLTKKQEDALLAYLFDGSQKKTSESDKGTNAKSVETNKTPSRPPYTHTGYNRFRGPEGYPAIEPPWGTLNAIDLNKGTIKWQVPLGEFPELAKQGMPGTGTENYGGPVVTAGGLVFIGAAKDEKLRAFDKATGEVLWSAKLPAGGYATPSTYKVNGKQYVVIAAGGGQKQGTKVNDTYVAFALPD